MQCGLNDCATSTAFSGLWRPFRRQTSIALSVANLWSQMTALWSLVANIVYTSDVSRDFSVLADCDARIAIRISPNLQHPVRSRPHLYSMSAWWTSGQCSTIQSWHQFDDIASWVPSRSSCVFPLLPSPGTSTRVCSLVRPQDGVVTCPRPKFPCVGTSVDLYVVLQNDGFINSARVFCQPMFSVCRRRQDFPHQSVTMESTPDPNWFSHGPLAGLGSLHGWWSPPVTQPGTGSQSWLFCPLISLVLSALGVFLRRAQDP